MGTRRVKLNRVFGTLFKPERQAAKPTRSWWLDQSTREAFAKAAREHDAEMQHDPRWRSHRRVTEDA